MAVSSSGAGVTGPLAMLPPLDQAADGNGRVLALVTPTNAIEWLCMPRVDSGSVSRRPIDRERGGCFRVLARDTEVTPTYPPVGLVHTAMTIGGLLEARDERVGAWV